MTEIQLWSLLKSQKIDIYTYNELIKDLKTPKKTTFSDGYTKPNTKGYINPAKNMKRKGNF